MKTVGFAELGAAVVDDAEMGKSVGKSVTPAASGANEGGPVVGKRVG
jgi:hypothetical protein